MMGKKTLLFFTSSFYFPTFQYLRLTMELYSWSMWYVMFSTSYALRYGLVVAPSAQCGA